MGHCDFVIISVPNITTFNKLYILVYIKYYAGASKGWIAEIYS